jgi:hypothetical protein
MSVHKHFAQDDRTSDWENKLRARITEEVRRIPALRAEEELEFALANGQQVKALLLARKLDEARNFSREWCRCGRGEPAGKGGRTNDTR